VWKPKFLRLAYFEKGTVIETGILLYIRGGQVSVAIDERFAVKGWVQTGKEERTSTSDCF